MKKYIPLIFTLIALGGLAGCNKSNKNTTDKSTNRTTTQTTQSSSMRESSDSSGAESSESEEPLNTTPVSVDDVRKPEPEKDVSLLRRQLYEAGINSSELSDSEIEEYAKQAEEKGIDFITYMRDTVLK